MDGSKPRVSEAFLVGCAGALLSLFVFFPGFMSDDSLQQLRQARAGVYSNVQPPVMSIIWRYVDMLLTGQTGMLVAQNFLYWSGLALVLLPFRGRSWLYFVLLAVVGLFPPYFLLQGAIWKDHWMGGFLLLAAGFGVAASLSDGAKRAALLIAVGISALLALLMRHNAALAVFPILYFVASRPRLIDWRALLIAGSSTLALFVASSFIGDAIATRHAPVSQQIAVFDLVGISARTGEPMFDPAKYPTLASAFDADYRDLRAVKERYDACNAFPIFVPSPLWSAPLWIGVKDGPEITGEAWAAWRDAAFKYPRELIAHKAKVFGCSLSFGQMGPWYAPIYFEQPVSDELGLFNRGLSPFQTAITTWAWYASMGPLWLVWPYFLLGLAIAVLAFLGKRPMDRTAFGIASSGLLYQLGYLFIGIGTEFRYYVWMILCAILSLALYIVPRIAERTPPRQPSKPFPT